MKKVIKAIKRMWVIATCDHYNLLEQFAIQEKHSELSIRVCPRCGRVIDGVQWSNEYKTHSDRTV
jgi:hypothetical protein